MPDIPIRVTGSGLETFDRIQNGFKKVQGAAAGAAAASRMPIRAPAGGLMPADFFPGVRMGNFGSGFTPAGWNRGGRDSLGRSEHGGHHGLFGAFHAAGRVTGGAFGEIAHRGLGLAGLGVAGAGVAVAGLAVNAFIAALERADKRLVEAFEVAGKFRDIFSGAQQAKMSMGLEAARDGNGLRQLSNQGLMDSFRKVRESGLNISPESFAALGGSKGRIEAVRVAHMLGAGIDQSADMAKMLGANANGTLAGRQIASQILGRPISAAEFGRAQANQGSGITKQLNAVERFQGKTANAKLGYLENGMAAAGAGAAFSDAANPAAKSLTDFARATGEAVEQFQALAEMHGKMQEAALNVARSFGIGEGSATQRANDKIDSFTAGEQMSH